MHIYFSGSISGGREDLPLYVEIVRELRALGHEVLEGEVTNPLLLPEGEHLSDAEIFARDLDWLAAVAAQGGALVAEVTAPSLGVGYEIAAARYRYRIPVVCLFWQDSGGDARP